MGVHLALSLLCCVCMLGGNACGDNRPVAADAMEGDATPMITGTVVATSGPVIADGVEEITLRVTVWGDETPLAGVGVTVAATGTGNLLSSDPGITASDGTFT